MLVYVKCECFVMQMLYVCVVCASCGSSQCCVLNDLQFVNAGRGILQSWSHNGLLGNHECLLLFPHSVAVSAFMICRGMCVCTEIDVVWMCDFYMLCRLASLDVVCHELNDCAWNVCL